MNMLPWILTQEWVLNGTWQRVKIQQPQSYQDWLGDDLITQVAISDWSGINYRMYYQVKTNTWLSVWWGQSYSFIKVMRPKLLYSYEWDNCCDKIHDNTTSIQNYHDGNMWFAYTTEATFDWESSVLRLQRDKLFSPECLKHSYFMYLVRRPIQTFFNIVA